MNEVWRQKDPAAGTVTTMCIWALVNSRSGLASGSGIVGHTIPLLDSYFLSRVFIEIQRELESYGLKREEMKTLSKCGFCESVGSNMHLIAGYISYISSMDGRGFHR